MSIGEIFVPGDLADAATSVLKRWLPLYLATLERRKGIPARSLPLPQSWRDSGESVEKWPEDALPALVVVAGGTDSEPSEDGEGFYRGAWRLAVVVLVDGGDIDVGGSVSPLDLAGYYGSAVRACLMDHRDLESFGAEGLDLLGEDYDEVNPDARRTMGAARVRFRVAVGQVLQAGFGPIGEPPDDPYALLPDPPAATDVQVDVDHLSD